MTSPDLLRFAAVIAAYWTVAISMVFVSKRLMSGSEVSSDISLLLVWTQNIVAVSSIGLPYLVCRALNKPWRGPVFRLKTLMVPDMIYASMCFTATLVFNNLMLKYISVAFYQVARSLTLIFVIAFSAAFLKERVTPLIVLSSTLIITGFYVSVDVEMISHGVQAIGIMYGILASLMAALCAVFFKRVQSQLKLGSMQLALNNSMISFATMTPLIISTGQLRDFISSPAVSNSLVWFLITLSGVISLVMGWVSASQITVTSPLTHNISINAKSVFQTLLAVAWSGESRSNSWWLGNVLVISGIGTYTYSKLAAMNNNSNSNSKKENGRGNDKERESSIVVTNHHNEGGGRSSSSSSFSSGGSVVSDNCVDMRGRMNGELKQCKD